MSDNPILDPVWDLRFLLDGCPDDDYQERILLRTKAFVDFLCRHDLVKKPLPRNWHNWKEARRLVISEANLTAEGKQVMRDALFRWLRYTDRNIDKVTNVMILEKSLEKAKGNPEDKSK